MSESLQSKVNSLDVSGDWRYLSPTIRDLVVCVIGRHFYFFKDKDELIQEGEIKAYELVYAPYRDPSRPMFGFLYTGIRNQLSNYIRKLDVYSDHDIETCPDLSEPCRVLVVDDPLLCRARMIEELLGDRMELAPDFTPEDVTLFLKIVASKTSMKEAYALTSTSLSSVALISLFLFSGRTIRYPSDETLERYLRYVSIYRDFLSGVGLDEIARKYDVRRVHIERIIESVKEIINGEPITRDQLKSDI